MNTKSIILVVLALLLSLSGYSQIDSKEKKPKVKLKKAVVVQDTILSTYPLVVSVKEDIILGKGEAQTTLANSLISLHPVPEKGVIYLKLDKLPKDYKPIITFYNTSGGKIRESIVRSKISTINLEKVPPGIYTVSIDINEERYTWEIEKE